LNLDQSKFNFSKLNVLANQIVEGFMSGIHKSPFHGYSAEFDEHRLYNKGDSVKFIDWKLYAKTDKLYIKKYEDETNLRCHFILDASSSMHYPKVNHFELDQMSKYTFSSLAILSLINILQKQNDAFGLSLFSDKIDFTISEKSSYNQLQIITKQLQEQFELQNDQKTTDTQTNLHYIAENLKRRSLVFLFSDMFQNDARHEKIFEALRYLKYNKHQVVFFHTTDFSKEINFDFSDLPRRFYDVETGQKIDLYPELVREEYKGNAQKFKQELLNKCRQYKIKYVDADINKGFEKIILTYLLEKQNF
jgi:uncharacterized protein (DUF58 family)